MRNIIRIAAGAVERISKAVDKSGLAPNGFQNVLCVPDEARDPREGILVARFYNRPEAVYEGGDASNCGQLSLQLECVSLPPIDRMRQLYCLLSVHRLDSYSEECFLGWLFGVAIQEESLGDCWKCSNILPNLELASKFPG